PAVRRVALPLLLDSNRSSSLADEMQQVAGIRGSGIEGPCPDGSVEIAAAKKYLCIFLQIALGSERAGQRGKSVSSELSWLSRQARPVLSLLTVNLICMVLGSGLSLLD